MYTEFHYKEFELKIKSTWICILILTMPMICHAQDDSNSEFINCFDRNEMQITENIYTHPKSIQLTKYDSTRFYVLNHRNLPLDQIRYQSNWALVEIFKSQNARYQKAVLANYSSDTIAMSGLFTRGLELMQEAQDSQGIWRPIEKYNSHVWCGVGAFNEVVVGPNEFINIFVPRYCGAFRTKLRLHLTTAEGVLYSEEFEGSIHPGQFIEIEDQEQRKGPTHFDRRNH